jgi:uncharacterized protein
VPLFLTQGLTEKYTVADGLAQYLENHTGYERAWLGPGDHVRGNDRDDSGRLLMGREGWFDEVMRFYDRFLEGTTPAVDDPPVAVQTNDGKWRAEDAWPPVDATSHTTPLRGGTYTDDGTANVTGDGAETGVWTTSPPEAHVVHLAGSGRVTVDLGTTLPNANLVVDVYDLGPRRQRPADHTPGSPGAQRRAADARAVVADWIVKAGHRIGVKVADANADWWVHVPIKQTVTVRGGSVSLPFLPAARPTGTIAGQPGTQLASYLQDTVTVPQSTIDEAGTPGFATP